jgi:hypothetical protein
VPEPQHSQYEHSSTPAKSYKLGPMSEPDQIQTDIENETSCLVVGVMHIPRSRS